LAAAAGTGPSIAAFTLATTSASFSTDANACGLVSIRVCQGVWLQWVWVWGIAHLLVLVW